MSGLGKGGKGLGKGLDSPAKKVSVPAGGRLKRKAQGAEREKAPKVAKGPGAISPPVTTLTNVQLLARLPREWAGLLVLADLVLAYARPSLCDLAALASDVIARPEAYGVSPEKASKEEDEEDEEEEEGEGEETVPLPVALRQMAHSLFVDNHYWMVVYFRAQQREPGGNLDHWVFKRAIHLHASGTLQEDSKEPVPASQLVQSYHASEWGDSEYNDEGRHYWPPCPCDVDFVSVDDVYCVLIDAAILLSTRPNTESSATPIVMKVDDQSGGDGDNTDQWDTVDIKIFAIPKEDTAGVKSIADAALVKSALTAVKAATSVVSDDTTEPIDRLLSGDRELFAPHDKYLQLWVQRKLLVTEDDEEHEPPMELSTFMTHVGALVNAELDDESVNDHHVRAHYKTPRAEQISVGARKPKFLP